MEKIRLVVDPAIADLVPCYLDDRRNDVAALTVLLERGAFGEIRRHGHQLAGSGKAFGVDAISAIGRALEQAAARGDGPAVASAVHRLREYLDALILVEPDSP